MFFLSNFLQSFFFVLRKFFFFSQFFVGKSAHNTPSLTPQSSVVSVPHLSLVACT